MESCKLPISYEYSKYLYYSSFLIGVSSTISMYYKDYSTVLFMFLLFLTSINYWKRPDYGFRRDVDMFLCKVIAVFFYLKTTIFYDEFVAEIFINSAYNIFFLYAMELLLWHYHNKKWIIFHMAIHFYLSVLTPVALYLI
jgi:hypothetical protein